MKIDKILERQLIRDGENLDYPLILVVLILMAVGLIMIYSATGLVINKEEVEISYYYLIRQFSYEIIIGLSCIFLFAFVSMRRWEALTYYLLLGSYLLLIAVILFGTEKGSTSRWLHLGFFNIQPAEFFKLVAVLYLASFLTRKAKELAELKKAWWVLVPIVIGCTLISYTGDLGSVIIVCLVSMCMLFLAGLKLRWFVTVTSIAILCVIPLVTLWEYRLQRIKSLLNPDSDPLGSGYQIIHSLTAIANGGWFGVGLGNAMETLYLPEIHTDFITALIAEELGAVSLIALLFAYIWIIWRAFSIGKTARNKGLFYSAYVATGIGFLLGIQSFVHMGVNFGILPNKGLTLPFISYGGSSLLVCLVAVTILLRIDYENRRKTRGYTI